MFSLKTVCGFFVIGFHLGILVHLMLDKIAQVIVNKTLHKLGGEKKP